MSGSSQATSPVEDRAPPPTTAPLGSHGSMGSMASIGSLGSVSSMTAVAGDVTTSDSHHQLQRRDSQGFVIVYNLLLINSWSYVITRIPLVRFSSIAIEHGEQRAVGRPTPR